MIEAGKFYGGVFQSFETVSIGEKGTPAIQFTFQNDAEGELISTQFIGDGKWLHDRLVEFGCNAVELVGAGWRKHIADVLKGKRIAAKAEEYNGRVNLKGIYKDGGGSAPKLVLDRSPFAASSFPDPSDADVPY